MHSYIRQMHIWTEMNGLTSVTKHISLHKQGPDYGLKKPVENFDPTSCASHNTATSWVGHSPWAVSFLFVCVKLVQKIKIKMKATLL
jgi:hypothetical protein